MCGVPNVQNGAPLGVQGDWCEGRPWLANEEGLVGAPASRINLGLDVLQLLVIHLVISRVGVGRPFPASSHFCVPLFHLIDGNVSDQQPFGR